MYENGRGVSQDYAKAVEWFLKSAEQGDADVQCNLGRMYENGRGVSQDYAKAVEWYRKSAEQGNAAAQGQLGYMYGLGRGISQDYVKAVEWYRKSAEQGNAAALCLLRNKRFFTDSIEKYKTIKGEEISADDPRLNVGVRFTF